VVDNHCHGILRSQRFDDRESWRRAFTESADPGMPRHHVAYTAFYRRLIRALADFFECDPDEEAVLATRTQRNAADLTSELLRSANVEVLLIDTGYPPPEEVLLGDELGKLADCLTEPMLRLEILMESLLAEHDSLQEVEVGSRRRWTTCGVGATWRSRASPPTAPGWRSGSGRTRRRRPRCASTGVPAQKAGRG